ncbi:unnamed protein product [Didymodactylos carnosus]|uniref:Uncharacterized protein n=1 Tax=Didymodactylos carnosus TaxID=1234261 RepID=A0A816AYK9_9BILA|nr:unnamed protein product [Didymodactylos carnosus]CAF4479342.1 unnamed protein product [Didymodactylos carnosus]
MFNEALINSLPINKSKSVDKAILAAVVKDGRSFGDFNRLGIRQLIATVVGTGYRIPSRFQIRRKLKYLYQVERQKLKDLLENVNYISLASGIWSNKSGDLYFGLTDHFLDDNFRTKHNVLIFKKFSGTQCKSLCIKNSQRIIEIKD